MDSAGLVGAWAAWAHLLRSPGKQSWVWGGWGGCGWGGVGCGCGGVGCGVGVGRGGAGPPARCPFTVSFLVGRVDYRKKVGTLILTSLLEDLALIYFKWNPGSLGYVPSVVVVQ